MSVVQDVNEHLLSGTSWRTGAPLGRDTITVYPVIGVEFDGVGTDHDVRRRYQPDSAGPVTG